MSTAAALPATARTAAWRSGWRLALVEHLPAFVVALLILPWVIAHGRAWPWQPSMIDFDVYRLAVQDMLQTRNIYDTATPGWNLKFIYPPIAAILMAPLALGPATFWRLVWTAGLVWAQQLVLRRCGLRRGLTLGLLGAVLLVALEPLRTTVGYGQVNTMLMAMVVADLLPDAEGERRQLPRGSLIGLAAAIKLTPLLFLVFAFLIGRRKVAYVGAFVFALLTGIGFLVMRSESLGYFGGLAKGSTGTTSPIYLGNQSLLGMTTRLAGGVPSGVVLASLALGGLLALAAAWIASVWWRQAPVAAMSLVGLATCLASPLSWTHHHVWVLPLLASLLLKERLPGWWQALAGVWVLWVAGAFILFTIPYGGGAERAYDPVQQLLANLTPGLTVVLTAGLIGAWLLPPRDRAEALA